MILLDSFRNVLRPYTLFYLHRDYCLNPNSNSVYCTRDKMVAAAEREKQLILARPDILHPIDEKMLELAGGGVGL